MGSACWWLGGSRKEAGTIRDEAGCEVDGDGIDHTPLLFSPCATPAVLSV